MDWAADIVAAQERAVLGNKKIMISKELLLFLLSERCTNNTSKVTESTRLQEDLGIYGDDAFDLIERFAAKFSVDISRFDIAAYFSPEGELDLIDFLKRILGFNQKKRKPFTIKHLQDAIDIGVLL